VGTIDSKVEPSKLLCELTPGCNVIALIQLSFIGGSGDFTNLKVKFVDVLLLTILK